MEEFNLSEVEQILEKYGLIVVQDMARYLQSTGTVNLHNDIKSEVNDGVLDVLIPAHGVFVNDGRKPNSKMPPAQPIAEWMTSKNIDEKLLYPIRRSIGIKGIRPRPFFHFFYDRLDILYLDIAKSAAEQVAHLLVGGIEQANAS